jgi:hypothetical protein
MDREQELRNIFYARLGTATRVLNTEIKKEIEDQKAVDTGRMKNTTKVKINYLEQKWTIQIQDLKTTDYFKYVNKGFSRKYQGGKKRRDIVGKFTKRSKFNEQIDKLIDAQMDWLIESQFKVNGI